MMIALWIPANYTLTFSLLKSTKCATEISAVADQAQLFQCGMCVWIALISVTFSPFT